MIPGICLVYDQKQVQILWLFYLALKLCVLFSEDGVYEGFPFLPNGVLKHSMNVP